MTMRTYMRFVEIAALVAASVSCGSVVRNGTSPVYLVMDSIAGIRGAVSTGTPSSFLISDVVTNVTTPAPCTPTSPCPTIFGDPGQASMHLALKDAAAQTAPSQFNAVTIERYHVDYTRADGRSTPGVDVPFAWDGVVTATVASTSPTAVGFLLVRSAAKEEGPLVQMRNTGQLLTVLAKVTFYGHDQTGNAVSVSGSIQIEFGDFGDF